ncbi:MAG TPA: sulfotransferase [Chitinophagaceae bacterium]
MSKPNFFIVGAPKCGTTAMNDYLDQHPDIFMAKKELHYFGKDLKTKMKISEAGYLEYFKGADQKIIGDASVWYLFSRTAAREIKDFCPGAKILIMLRNPVDVIHSIHSQHLYDGNEDIEDFEKAIDLDDKRKSGLDLPDSLEFAELPSYKDTALFFEQVKRYIDIFGKSNVRIILYEDFKMNTRHVVGETLEFLGLDSHLPLDYKVINKNRRIKWFYLHRLIKKPSTASRKMFRAIMPVKKFRHAIMLQLSKWNIKTGQRDEMSNARRDELKSNFSKDIEQLAALINRDLSAWL